MAVELISQSIILCQIAFWGEQSLRHSWMFSTFLFPTSQIPAVVEIKMYQSKIYSNVTKCSLEVEFPSLEPLLWTERGIVDIKGDNLPSSACLTKYKVAKEVTVYFSQHRKRRPLSLSEKGQEPAFEKHQLQNQVSSTYQWHLDIW